MVIPRHYECDICGKPIGSRTGRRYIIKSKGSLGNIKHDICSECMYAITQEIKKRCG